MRCIYRLLVIVFLTPITDQCLTAQSRPNIIVISVDDMNDWQGFTGEHPHVQTPNMDMLANEGFTFLNAHTVATACNPSRAAMLSGLSPSYSKIFSNGPDFKMKQMLPYVYTMVDYFNDEGYYTAGYGKVFHPEKETDDLWDKHEKLKGHPSPEMVPLHFEKNDWAAVDQDESEWGDYQIATRVIEELQRTDHDKPFMIHAGFRKPHAPWYVPQADYDLFDEITDYRPFFDPDDTLDIPDEHIEIGDKAHFLDVYESGLWNDAVRTYLALIKFTDRQIGRILEALKGSEYHSNTMVILWSDHGYHLGEKARWKKSTLWNRSTRIPLIFYSEDIVQGTSNELVSSLDIFPTMISLIGNEVPPYLHGVDLKPFLTGSNQEPRDHITSFIDQYFSIITDTLKYNIYNDTTYEVFGIEDFDETNNLAFANSNFDISSVLHAYELKRVEKPQPVTVPVVESSNFDGTNQILGSSMTANTHMLQVEYVEQRDSGDRIRIKNSLTGTISFPPSNKVKIRSLNAQYASDWVEVLDISYRGPTEVEEDQNFVVDTGHFDVSDAFGVFDSEFSFVPSEGEHFTLDGNVLTPDKDFNGSLTLPVQVYYNNLAFGLFNLDITITPLNDVPVIIGYSGRNKLREEKSLDLKIEDFEIQDLDEQSIDEFSLILGEGDNFNSRGLTITPEMDFSGTINVPVFVSDGASNSEVFELELLVTPVNDVPVIEGYDGELVFDQGEAITFKINEFNVHDPDNQFPEDHDLIVITGDFYTFDDRTIYPAEGFIGDLIVHVKVSDGEDISDSFNLTLTFLEVVSVAEDLLLDGEVSVFPNPISGSIACFIKSSYIGMVKINLINAVGRSLSLYESYKSEEVLKIQVDTDDLPAGTYLINVDFMESGNRVTRRLLKI